jgi:acetyl esterase/lipase
MFTFQMYQARKFVRSVRTCLVNTYITVPNETSALMFHAGGFVLGSTAMIPKTQIAYLVEHGFVVVTPEYRLCPQVSLYDGPVQDAKDVLKWCQEELPALLKERDVHVDGKKIVAMGHSAGGLLAVTAVCYYPFAPFSHFC